MNGAVETITIPNDSQFIRDTLLIAVRKCASTGKKNKSASDPPKVKKLQTWQECGFLNHANLISPRKLMSTILEHNPKIVEPTSRGQNLRYVSEFIKKADAARLGCSEKYKTTIAANIEAHAKFIEAPYHVVREDGEKTPKQKAVWHDFDDVKAKYLHHYNTSTQQTLGFAAGRTLALPLLVEESITGWRVG
jgi:hypothetical protein